MTCIISLLCMFIKIIFIILTISGITIKHGLNPNSNCGPNLCIDLFFVVKMTITTIVDAMANYTLSFAAPYIPTM